MTRSKGDTSSTLVSAHPIQRKSASCGWQSRKYSVFDGCIADDDSQLAVVRGLVTERTQQLGKVSQPGLEVFRTRRCRNSYGVVVREPYNPDRHKGLPVATNKYTGQKFVEELIEFVSCLYFVRALLMLASWFIVRGDEIDAGAGIRRPYCADLTDQNRFDERQVRIVSSRLQGERLPQLLSGSGWDELVRVRYRLTDGTMKLIRNRWRPKASFWRAEFSFVVKLGPADISFQIESANGIINTDTVEAEFMDHDEQTQGLLNGSMIDGVTQNGNVGQNGAAYSNGQPQQSSFKARYQRLKNLAIKKR